MDFIDMINEKACTVSLVAETKKECLVEIARLVSFAESDFEPSELLKAFEQREKQGSTGFENGIAIPHARLKNTDKFVLGIAVSKKGVEFESIDGKKCQIFFALVGPEENPREFLRLLAQVSRITKNASTRKEFLSAKSALLLKEIFIKHMGGESIAEKPKGKLKLFTLVLYETKYLDDISHLFLERGIRGASVVQSTGMKGVLSNVPLFADFLNFLSERKEDSRTITAIIGENQVAGLVEGIESIVGDLEAHSGAAVYTTDITFMKGSLEVL